MTWFRRCALSVLLAAQSPNDGWLVGQIGRNVRRAAAVHTRPTPGDLPSAGSKQLYSGSLTKVCVLFAELGTDFINARLSATGIRFRAPKLILIQSAHERIPQLALIVFHQRDCSIHTLFHIMATPNSYFVPGYGISRAVIQNEIRYHCGPDAIVRPYTFQVGFPYESMLHLYWKHSDGT